MTRYDATASRGYDTGYHDGVADGYDEGYDEGHRKGGEDALRRMVCALLFMSADLHLQVADLKKSLDGPQGDQQGYRDLTNRAILVCLSLAVQYENQTATLIKALER